MIRITLVVTMLMLTGTLTFGQRVGIGTDSPLEEIHFHSAISTHLKVLLTPMSSSDSSSIMFSEDPSAVFGMRLLYDGVNNKLNIFGEVNGVLSGPHMTIKRSSSQVGIGVINPSQSLDIVGAIRLGNTTSDLSGSIRWTGTDFEGYDGSQWLSMSSTNKWSEEPGSDTDIFYNNGFVGIGDSTPNYPLEIEDLSSARTVVITNNYTGSQGQYGVLANLDNDGTGSKVGLYATVSNGGATPNNSLYGLFGIVSSGASGTHYGVYGDAGGDDNYAIYGDNTATGGWAGYFNGRGHVAQTMTIGTQDELGMLHVHDPDNSAAGMYVTPEATSSEDSSFIFLGEDHDATFGMMWQYEGVGNYLELFGKANSTVYGPHMRIQRNSGDIAVGNTFANGYKMSIDGKVACEELRVDLSGDWPDYVFDASYPRKSISELKTFIADNNRLPGIPAAAEMESGGLEIGEMQRKMMEKIEELTLYIIDLNSDLEQIKGINAGLTVRISELENAKN